MTRSESSKKQIQSIFVIKYKLQSLIKNEHTIKCNTINFCLLGCRESKKKKIASTNKI